MWPLKHWLDSKVLEELKESDRRIQKNADNIRKRIVYKESFNHAIIALAAVLAVLIIHKYF